MSQGGSCYSGCQGVSGRGHRQGAREGFSAVWVLIRLVLRSSIWHFPSTPAPGSLSLLTWTLSDAHPPTSLSSILCWHRQTAPSVTRLINSCWDVIPTATVVHARAFALLHTSTSSTFPIWRQSSVCQFAHFDMFWHFSCSSELLQLQDSPSPSDQMNWFWSALTE